MNVNSMTEENEKSEDENEKLKPKKKEKALTTQQTGETRRVTKVSF